MKIIYLKKSFLMWPYLHIYYKFIIIVICNYCLAISPVINAEDFQPLSEKEEQDLELLMKECGFAAKDAKAFTDMLANQLMTLDGVSNSYML